MLAELGDVDIHRARVEVIVVDPDGLESEITLENLVDVGAEEREELALLGGEFGDLVINEKYLLLRIESEFADLVHGHFLAWPQKGPLG